MTPRSLQAAVAPAEGWSSPLTRVKRVLPFLGPAFVASIAYMDPGNFATNIQAGADYGYMLLWVLLLSNLMAILIQSLSAKLGIAAGMTLPQAIRLHSGRRTNIGLWLTAEAAAMATDLAEFLGAAVGMHILFGLALFPSALVTAVLSFAILAFERRGHSRFEILIIGFVAVIGACFFVEIFISHPDPAGIVRGMVVPGINSGALYVAVGMVGATVMPHVVYLHSGLVQRRNDLLEGNSKRQHFHRELVDIALAMNGAWLINSSMVIMASAVFFSGGVPISGIEDAQATLRPLLGQGAAYAFGIALLASGLSSSTVGTMAGQMIVDGFMQWRVSVFVRRFVTMIPALIVIGLGANTLTTLVASQVVLSMTLPFAVVPLVWLTSRRDVMGDLVNGNLTRALAVLVACLVIAMNVVLLAVTAFG
ncbi:MAG: manganese transport protein [Gaiellales bacterium]|jgi:manganese transport protein|nr:manganese transport protein [Gaiellales bacterium]